MMLLSIRLNVFHLNESNGLLFGFHEFGLSPLPIHPPPAVTASFGKHNLDPIPILRKATH